MAKTSRFRVLDEKQNLLDLADRVESIVRLAGFILAATFAALKLSGSDTASILAESSDQAILNTTVCLYYTSWVMGPISDLRAQRNAYFKAPWAGKLTRAATGSREIM